MTWLDPIRTRLSLRPVLDWTPGIFYYMQEHDLPQHPLFDRGYSRLVTGIPAVGQRRPERPRHSFRWPEAGVQHSHLRTRLGNARGRHLTVVDPAVCSTGLLIGNSRWHWAEPLADRWRFDHSPPDLSRLAMSPPVWAAVGPVPETPFLKEVRRLTLADVPLKGCPPWLGVDRALGAFSALSRCVEQQLDYRAGVLLADAGTVLSLTLLDPAGGFRGGQLIPGLRMQLQAMAEGAAGLGLPTLDVESHGLFPRQADATMWRGSLQALVGALEAHR